MKTIQAMQSNTDLGQSTDEIPPNSQLSPYDLACIRNSGSAELAVDLAGWLRRLLHK